LPWERTLERRRFGKEEVSKEVKKGRDYKVVRGESEGL